MLIFDLDGTLTDSNGVWEAVDLAFLSRRGLTATEEYAHTVGHSIFPIAAQFTRDYFHLDMTPQAIMDEWTLLAGDAYAHVPLKEGARAFLDRCRDEGETLVLLTACVPALCRAALQTHGLEDHFSQLFFAMDMGLEKRDPEVYRRAIDALGVRPQDCTFFEDAPANCTAAKTLGIKVVGVYDEFYKKYEDEMRETCDRYITSFRELLA